MMRGRKRFPEGVFNFDVKVIRRRHMQVGRWAIHSKGDTMFVLVTDE